MREISIIVLIYRKLGPVGPVQQKIKLPSPWFLEFLLRGEFLSYYLIIFVSEDLIGLTRASVKNAWQ